MTDTTTTTETVADATDSTASADTAVTTSETTTASTPGEGQGATETPAVPEAYTFNLPEGLALEGERLESTTALFKRLQLPQDKAQELVDFFVAIRGDGEAAADALIEQRTQQRVKDWNQQLPTVFGEQFPTVQADARKAVAAVNRPELMEAFDAEGWGSHPELVRAFAYFGKLIGDDGLKGLGSVTAGAATPDDPRQRWFPDLAK